MPAFHLAPNAVGANRPRASVMVNVATGMRPMIGMRDTDTCRRNPITPLVR